MLERYKRIVVKIGSALIADEEHRLRKEWMQSVASDIAVLMKGGKQVILVSSGAVALGRHKLGYGRRALALEEKQAAAACGQITLFSQWAEAFAQAGMAAEGAAYYPAQLLLTADDSVNRRRYLNARATLETLLAAPRVVPVINENDTVATQELRFGDNDRLAARVAQMSMSDCLILLSDIDGLYTADPRKDPQAKHLTEISAITPEIEAMAGGARSAVSSGGMQTKVMAAKIALSAGCDMLIAQGEAPHPIAALRKDARHTRFIAQNSPQNARKNWIGGSLHAMGALIIDDGAASALRSGKSLLPAGVTEVEGQFARGDAVWIRTQSGETIGKGLSAYHAEDARQIIGKRSAEIPAILGYKGRDALIHRDDMALQP